MRTRRWLGIGGAAAGVLALLAWALAPRPVAVETARVGVGPLETAIEEDGKTRLRDHYLVSAPLAGLVGRIALREGDPVAAGAVVATLRPAFAPLLDQRARREQGARLGAAQAQVRAATAALERARIALRSARHDAQRSAELAQAGFVAASRLENDQLAALAAQTAFDSASAQRQIALHEVEQARAALDASANPANYNAGKLAVRAPVDGRVLRVVQASEAVVALGTPLLELGDPRRLEVVAELLTADALQSRPGSPVRLDRWGGPALRGRVRLIEPAAFTKISALGVEEQRVRVLIDLLDAPGKADSLGVGYRVNVRIITLSVERVRKVPVSAVFPLPGSTAGAGGAMAVYAVRDGRARLTRVRLGARNDLEAWVRDGLAEGEQVVVYPAAEVRDGARVSVRSTERTL
ncbi:HlyD family efflux transporter periplasmic adaptor subunit [Massilia violaceinigra]|uniref:HlyD family efflux transporter periplasmic adaptor subunit n=1 Tax=Massilia violaceinigra TaxID=2045208 RepID=A0ABY4A2L5_9BURK|nr:HlyD family efflux transporter periplasmic adaptor subunit [Massilia violaceinigra]UOD28997.1 HlyD family efflux transporter periplasmic adaptor subunit [Massilia violaceinigra]